MGPTLRPIDEMSTCEAVSALVPGSPGVAPYTCRVVQLSPSPLDVTEIDLDAGNAELEAMAAEARVAWALDRLRPHIVLSSSFGAQAAVLLHMVTRQWPEIPVVVVDTGYLFPETYRSSTSSPSGSA